MNNTRFDCILTQTRIKQTSSRKTIKIEVKNRQTGIQNYLEIVIPSLDDAFLVFRVLFTSPFSHDLIFELYIFSWANHIWRSIHFGRTADPIEERKYSNSLSRPFTRLIQTVSLSFNLINHCAQLLVLLAG